jgi:uncharacterized protein (TIGR00255 family)
MNSMTGFGRAEITIQQFGFTIEAKSVNHRYLDLGIKLPRKLAFLEEQIRNIIKSSIRRGRLDLYINQQTAESSDKRVVIDKALCQAYQESFEKISQELQIENDLTVALLARMPEVLTVEQQDVDEDLLWNEMEKGIISVLDQLIGMRATEGETLYHDLKERITFLKQKMEEISRISPEVSLAYQDRLIKRINEMAGQEMAIDENRMMTEVAILAEKSSIEEEVVRFNSHLDQFSTTMIQQEPVGRKLDFLVQELNREINTISSKSNDQKVSRLVVEVKSELEKIREQVQNIE